MKTIEANPLPVLAPLLERENDFLTWVIDLAHVYGYRVAHFRGAWSKDGQRFTTPVQADGKGFPDLCLIHSEKKRIIWSEVKSERGKPSKEQWDWLEALAKAGAEVYLWRPSDKDEIEEVLQ